MAVVNHFDQCACRSSTLVPPSRAHAPFRQSCAFRCSRRTASTMPRTVMATGRERAGAGVGSGRPHHQAAARHAGRRDDRQHPERGRNHPPHLWGLDHDVCPQEFVAESKGRDIRALVVGDQWSVRWAPGAARRVPVATAIAAARASQSKLDVAYQRLAVEGGAVRSRCAASTSSRARAGPRLMESTARPASRPREKATQGHHMRRHRAPRALSLTHPKRK